MQYFELTFHLTPNDEAARDVLAALLADAGCETFVPTDAGQTAYIQQSTFDEAAIQAAIDSFKAFFPQVEVTFTCADAPDENWNATWEEEHHFEPITLPQLPSRENRDAPTLENRNASTPGGQQIRIIPRQAFGSGEHATTRMMLRLLAEADPRGKAVIDAGCGTGVLGIAAMKLGARSLFAHDIDEWSVRNTLDNFALNNLPAAPFPAAVLPASFPAAVLPAGSPLSPLSSPVPCSVGGGSSAAVLPASFPAGSPLSSPAAAAPPSSPVPCSVGGGSSAAQLSTFNFQLSTLIALGDATCLSAAPVADLLLANINRNILLADLPAFASHITSGGHLLLSGFLEADIPSLTEAATPLGLQLQSTLADGEWRALKFLKS